MKKRVSNCESCENFEYDYELECEVCSAQLDEDEMYRFLTGSFTSCPYYRINDEYRIVKKQN